MTSIHINELPTKVNSLDGDSYLIISKKINNIWTSFKVRLSTIVSWMFQ